MKVHIMRWAVQDWRTSRVRPAPRQPQASAQEIHEQELRTRDRMNRRGGPDRQAVRSGRT